MRTSLWMKYIFRSSSFMFVQFHVFTLIYDITPDSRFGSTALILIPVKRWRLLFYMNVDLLYNMDIALVSGSPCPWEIKLVQRWNLLLWGSFIVDIIWLCIHVDVKRISFTILGLLSITISYTFGCIWIDFFFFLIKSIYSISKDLTMWYRL